LVLDAQLETSSKLHHQCLGIHVTRVGDQGLEVVQIVIYCPTSLVVRGSFQSVDRICFHIHWKEVKSELLLEVPPGWYGENASVHFLTEDVLRPLGSTTILEKRESPENFFLLVIELLRG